MTNKKQQMIQKICAIMYTNIKAQCVTGPRRVANNVSRDASFVRSVNTPPWASQSEDQHRQLNTNIDSRCQSFTARRQARPKGQW